MRKFIAMLAGFLILLACSVVAADNYNTETSQQPPGTTISVDEISVSVMDIQTLNLQPVVLPFIRAVNDGVPDEKYKESYSADNLQNTKLPVNTLDNSPDSRPIKQC